jgi:hypothetical protein
MPALGGRRGVGKAGGDEVDKPAVRAVAMGVAGELLEISDEDIGPCAKQDGKPLAEGTLSHAALADDNEDPAAVRVQIMVDDASQVPAALEKLFPLDVFRFQGLTRNEGTGDLRVPGLNLVEFVLLLLYDIEPETSDGKESLKEWVGLAARGVKEEEALQGLRSTIKRKAALVVVVASSTQVSSGGLEKHNR